MTTNREYTISRADIDGLEAALTCIKQTGLSQAGLSVRDIRIATELHQSTPAS